MAASLSHPCMAHPSPWVARFAPLIRPGGSVLDLACGGGRHARMLLERGFAVTALDRDTDPVADLSHRAEVLAADLEDGSPWPLAGRRFDGVVVTNYLHRPLFPLLIDLLADGGVLIYETFMRGNEAYARPRNPDHLLRPGELLEHLAPLQVVAFEQGYQETPRPSVAQRAAAVKGAVPVPIPTSPP